MKKEILSKELYRISDFLYKNKIVFLEVSIDTMKDNYTDIKFGELYINLDKIVSVSNQAGAGKKGMFEIIKFADKYNLPIMLIASSSMGSDLDRLINFYKEFGFNLIEEIDDDAEKSKSSMPNITATYPSEAINFFDDQARRMPFQLGFEFQEIKGLCKWALANNTFQKKPFRRIA